MMRNQTINFRNSAAHSSGGIALELVILAFFWPARLQASGFARQPGGRQQSHHPKWTSAEND
jgi:hypothetical protein